MGGGEAGRLVSTQQRRYGQTSVIQKAVVAQRERRTDVHYRRQADTLPRCLEVAVRERKVLNGSYVTPMPFSNRVAVPVSTAMRFESGWQLFSRVRFVLPLS